MGGVYVYERISRSCPPAQFLPVLMSHVCSILAFAKLTFSTQTLSFFFVSPLRCCFCFGTSHHLPWLVVMGKTCLCDIGLLCAAADIAPNVSPATAMNMAT